MWYLFQWIRASVPAGVAKSFSRAASWMSAKLLVISDLVLALLLGVGFIVMMAWVLAFYLLPFFGVLALWRIVF